MNIGANSYNASPITYNILCLFSVQAKYGVGGDMPSMLVLVPSHVPQCVEIFNGKNI